MTSIRDGDSKEPSSIDDASLWFSTRFSDLRSYQFTLDDVARQELVEATRLAVAAKLGFDRLTTSNFRLPNMMRLLAHAKTALEDGRGFCVLRGVPVEELDDQGAGLMLAGISAHLGELVCQSVHRNKIEEIADRKQPLDHASRGYAGTRGLPFHTDGADYAGLLCLAMAKKGGESLLASGAAAHETIRAERPDLLEVLKQGLFHHRRGEQLPGEASVLPGRQPVFRIQDGRMHVFYNRNSPDWLAREGIEVSRAEIEAQDCLDEVLERGHIQLRMQLQPGDLQLINNYTILHSRTAYQDAGERTRRLLRVWIRAGAPRRGGPNIIDVYAPWESRTRGRSGPDAGETGDHTR